MLSYYRYSLLPFIPVFFLPLASSISSFISSNYLWKSLIYKHIVIDLGLNIITLKLSLKSIVYHIRKKYRSKLLYDLNPKIISDWMVDAHMHVPGYTQKSHFTFSKFVRNTLLNFFASDSQEVTQRHLKINIFYDPDCPSLVHGSSLLLFLLLLHLLIFLLFYPFFPLPSPSLLIPSRSPSLLPFFQFFSSFFSFLLLILIP